jgi:hypothetical protein
MKRRGEREPRAIYRRDCLRRGLGFHAREEIGRWQDVGLGLESGAGKRKKMMRGAAVSARWGGWGDTLSGRSDTRPGRIWRLDRILPLGLLLFFSIFFSLFYFSNF